MSTINDFFGADANFGITAAGKALISKDTITEQRTALGVLPTIISLTEPASPVAGDTWMDTTAGIMKVYSGTIWHQMSNRFTATGGTITESGGYRIHTFTSSGTFTALATGNVDVLVVAGGGGGGGNHGGGGGAGGLVQCTGKSIPPIIYSVVIGAGGIGRLNGDTGATNGVNSTFSDITAIGGGCGGAYINTISPAVGGSGAGGTSVVGGTSGAVANQGNSGGGTGYGNTGGDSNTGNVDWPGAGGGGAGGAGGDATSTGYGGGGGGGLDISISGSSTYYAGGGGGCGTMVVLEGSSGVGGVGGGGVGAYDPLQTPGAGTTNTGGGGGGCRESTPRGGSGGSGIVIIRYLI